MNAVCEEKDCRIVVFSIVRLWMSGWPDSVVTGLSKCHTAIEPISSD